MDMTVSYYQQAALSGLRWDELISDAILRCFVGATSSRHYLLATTARFTRRFRRVHRASATWILRNACSLLPSARCAAACRLLGRRRLCSCLPRRACRLHYALHGAAPAGGVERRAGGERGKNARTPATARFAQPNSGLYHILFWFAAACTAEGALDGKAGSARTTFASGVPDNIDTVTRGKERSATTHCVAELAAPNATFGLFCRYELVASLAALRLRCRHCAYRFNISVFCCLQDVPFLSARGHRGGGHGGTATALISPRLARCYLPARCALPSGARASH